VQLKALDNELTWVSELVTNRTASVVEIIATAIEHLSEPSNEEQALQIHTFLVHTERMGIRSRYHEAIVTAVLIAAKLCSGPGEGMQHKPFSFSLSDLPFCYLRPLGRLEPGCGVNLVDCGRFNPLARYPCDENAAASQGADKRTAPTKHRGHSTVLPFIHSEYTKNESRCFMGVPFAASISQ
jgi:hypothetical protein